MVRYGLLALGFLTEIIIQIYSYVLLYVQLYVTCALSIFSITGVQLGVCIAFHVIVGDLGPSLISKWTGVEVRQLLLAYLSYDQYC